MQPLHGLHLASADNKVDILHDLLEILPQIAADTQTILCADMIAQQLDASDIYEFNYSNDLLRSMLYLLNEDPKPINAYFCNEESACILHGGGVSVFSTDASAQLLQHTPLFSINEELSNELIEQPAAYLGLDSDLPYDPTLIYYPNARQPARAATMLGSAQRAIANRQQNRR